MGTVAVIVGTINTPPPTPTKDPKTPAPKPRGTDILVAIERFDSLYTSQLPANISGLAFGSPEDIIFFSATLDVLGIVNPPVAFTLLVGARATSSATRKRAPTTEDTRRSIKDEARTSSLV